MFSFTLELSDIENSLPWVQASYMQPRPDDLIIALNPNSNRMSIYQGRELLDWALWMPLDKFHESVKQLRDSAKTRCGG